MKERKWFGVWHRHSWGKWKTHIYKQPAYQVGSVREGEHLTSFQRKTCKTCNLQKDKT